MNVTPRLYKSVAEPPAHVARIHDSGALLIGGPQGTVVDGAVILRLEHVDTKDRFNQLFLMSRSQMAHLADELARFLSTWEQSHESEQGGA
jgi:hypothetical protein